MRKTLAVALLVLVTGCRLLVPKTCALEDVHEAYRHEFAALVLPGEPVAKPPGPGPTADCFPETLRRIRVFTAQYGQDSSEAAHLKVLEGMIYLQTGRLTMAEAVKATVTSAEKALISGSGVYTRDALFAKAYPRLLEGYQEIQKASGTATPPRKENFLNAAHGIKSALDELQKDGLLADSEVDQGAVHLATSAAIFYVWAASFTTPPDRSFYAEGHALIGRHLSDTEKAASAKMGGPPYPGRLRYLAWYNYLR